MNFVINGQMDKYRLILENVREFAIFSADLEGRIDEWNPGAQRLFGYSNEEILGRPMDILYVPEDRAAGRVEIEKAGAAANGFSEDERWHLRKDGSRLFVSGMVNAMYDDNKKLCGFIKVAHDITPRKILAERLAASEAQYKAILETIQDFAVVTMDLDGNIESWNPGAKATYGYEPDEAIGRNFGFLLPPEDQRNHLPERRLNEVTQQGVSHAEGWCVRKDGARIFVIDAFRLMPNNPGESQRILKVSRDITVRHVTRMKLESTQQQLERVQQALEVKFENRTTELQQSVQSLDQVLYHVAHDLRAPLRKMEGFSSILMRKYIPKLDSEAERLTNMISGAAKQMDKLIHDLLLYGRICSDQIESVNISTQAALDAALSTLDVDLRNAHAEVEVNSPLYPVRGDYQVLRQVFCELISNAIAFSAADRKIQVRVYSEHKDGLVRIWVEDNGIGIAAEHLDRIFWIFERLSDSSGTGMGLAIAKKGVERMGGKIGVESSFGRGSRFWIELLTVKNEET
jgi:PAS domain S-box-containing protein